MLVRLTMTSSLWITLLCASVLASGCAGVFPQRIVHDYCLVAQKPFQWNSDEEIDATPIRPLRYIEVDAETYRRLCK